MDFLLDKYFGFLSTEQNFKGPYTYNYVREVHTDYVKGDLIVKIAFEGDYWVDIVKLKKPDPDIENGSKRVVDLDSSGFKYYTLGQLDHKKKLWNSISSDNFPEKRLWYFLNILRKNPEILNGNLEKFTLRYKLLKGLHLK
jgi:hypothetical protein